LNVSVVVPTFNRRDIVLRTIRTLFDQDFPANQFEIIVVVDGSTDGSAEALRLLPAPCRYLIIEQQNLGPAAARNHGLRNAGNDLILFVDDDMLCNAGLVRTHHAAHIGDSAIIGMGSIFLSPDSPVTLASECFNREIGAYYLEQKSHPPTRPLRPPLVFSNTSVPKRLLLEAGSFDERLKVREDADLGIRLLANGASAQHLPHAITFQIYRKTESDLMREAAAFAAADSLIVRKHSELANEILPSWLKNGPGWKRRLYRVGSLSPPIADLFLLPAIWAGRAFVQSRGFRALGARALQIRRGITWYRRFKLTEPA
jgi:glycosyltransferase involved in cell wall biosynthesis